MSGGEDPSLLRPYPKVRVSGHMALILKASTGTQYTSCVDLLQQNQWFFSALKTNWFIMTHTFANLSLCLLSPHLNKCWFLRWHKMVAFVSDLQSSVKTWLFCGKDMLLPSLQRHRKTDLIPVELGSRMMRKKISTYTGKWEQSIRTLTMTNFVAPWNQPLFNLA